VVEAKHGCNVVDNLYQNHQQQHQLPLPTSSVYSDRIFPFAATATAAVHLLVTKTAPPRVRMSVEVLVSNYLHNNNNNNSDTYKHHYTIRTHSYTTVWLLLLVDLFSFNFQFQCTFFACAVSSTNLCWLIFFFQIRLTLRNLSV